uniref:SMP-30/gluconolactonase/LRE family protein n=1 Tax=Aminobacter niigataensis TaxID=83265 RepID=UPI002852D2EE|nr:SMP-30/gluconolactonase/LRE family protein [Aminobacter niigataensis]WMD00103.1 SMP-30/gluconolactonase/LRE family protein [Aminobacter niigataensis]
MIPTARMAHASRAFEISDLALDVDRPECVLATASGDLFMSDARGGVTHRSRDGVTRLIAGKGRSADFLPNGIALLRDRSFLIANLGSEGGVWRLTEGGDLTPWLMEVNGTPLPACNFVGIDAEDRVWISVSTRRVPRWDAYQCNAAHDGFVVLVDRAGARIAAEGFHYTNEAKVDPSGRWLYVNETAGRRLNRVALDARGNLGAREIVAEFGAGTFPDGLAFDVEGSVWVTSVVSNRLFRVWPDRGKVELVFEDLDESLVELIEGKFSSGVFPGLKPGMNGISSLAFGGPDLRMVYLGYSKGNRISSLKSPVAGVAPPHWHF